jgi:hypothetical protein
MSNQGRFQAVADPENYQVPQDSVERYARLAEEYDRYIASLTPADTDKGKEWDELTEEEQAFILRQTG